MRTLTAPGGKLVLALYNDQGWLSQFWKEMKRSYNKNLLARGMILSSFIPGFIGIHLLADLLRGRNPLHRYIGSRRARGMSQVHDWFDWLGGYPFEVAKPDEVVRFYEERDFHLEKAELCGRKSGNNQFVLVRKGP